MDTIEDSDCDNCALPVDTGCWCDVPNWFSVDIAINIRLHTTARNATNDALEILNCDKTIPHDYEFSIDDFDVTLIGDPKYVP